MRARPVFSDGPMINVDAIELPDLDGEVVRVSEPGWSNEDRVDHRRSARANVGTVLQDVVSITPDNLVATLVNEVAEAAELANEDTAGFFTWLLAAPVLLTWSLLKAAAKDAVELVLAPVCIVKDSFDAVRHWLKS